MPIPFACPCGRAFRVKDEYAGKKTKCPACAAVLTVPVPPPPTVDEDEAFRLLNEAPLPERTARPAWSPPAEAYADVSARVSSPAPPPAEEPAAPPRPKKKRKRPQRWQSDVPRISLSPAVLGGLAALVGGGVFIYLAVEAGRVPIRAVVLAGFGLLAVARGVLGAEEA